MRQLITICCVAIWVLLIGNVLSADGSKPNPNETTRSGGRSVSDFISADGRFDLNAVRSSGYQGPLDLKGVDVRVDPRSGVPTFAALPQSPAEDTDDVYWDNSISQSIPGVDGIVYAMTIYEGKLIVGGIFSLAGKVQANNIASWDGTSWESLSTGVWGDVNSHVNALAVHDGKLVVGGSFQIAGDQTAQNIAVWDGSEWSVLGAGLNGEVLALTVWNGELCAGGDFDTAGGVAADNVASWDGSVWSSLGSGTNGPVKGLIEFDTKLIARGAFNRAGGDTANFMAAWDGANWTKLNNGAMFGGSGGSVVLPMAIYKGMLVITVVSDYEGVRYVAWNGTNWSTLSHTYISATRPALVVLDTLLIVGAGETVYGTNGTDASALGYLFEGEESGCGFCDPGPCYPEATVCALIVYDGRLVVGGDFSKVEGKSVANIATWDQAMWSSIDVNAGFSTRVFATYNNQLVAGGWTIGGCDAAPRIAIHDGTGWSLIDSGKYGRVNALVQYDNKLIAGGYFDSTGSTLTNSIARWDGDHWDSLGSGLSQGSYPGEVYSLAVYDGKLIVGGYFRSAGGIATNNIASWDGNSWSALGAGWDIYGYVYALTVYDGNLIAAGSFRSIGGDVALKRIASWDGRSWAPLDTGLAGGAVKSLTVYNNSLIAGGEFTMAGDVQANRVASWDGSSWQPLGFGLGYNLESPPWPIVTALDVYDGKLIAVGRFTMADSQSVDHIACWDGSRWSGMGSGLSGLYQWPDFNPIAYALYNFDNKLVVGGSFYTSGGKAGANIALWTKHDPTGVDEGQTKALPDAFSLIQNYPNPFNPTTIVEYDVPTRAHVTVEIYNVLGQHVITLVDETKSAGKYKTDWNGTDAAGKVVSTGVYLYRFSAGDFVETKKMLLLK